MAACCCAWLGCRMKQLPGCPLVHLVHVFERNGRPTTWRGVLVCPMAINTRAPARHAPRVVQPAGCCNRATPVMFIRWARLFSTACLTTCQLVTCGSRQLHRQLVSGTCSCGCLQSSCCQPVAVCLVVHGIAAVPKLDATVAVPQAHGSPQCCRSWTQTWPMHHRS